MDYVLNFLYGAYALARGINLSLLEMIQFQLLGGLIIGFTLATMVYAFLLTKNPKPLCLALSRVGNEGCPRWPLVGLTCLDASVLRHFSTLRDKIIFVSVSGVVIFLSIILVALLFF